MHWGNGHDNQCFNHVFKVYNLCHHCSTMHKVPNRLGSTMMCLSDSSLSNTSHNSFAHHHPMAVNNESTNFYCDDDMHDNNDNSNSKVVDNDSNCLHDTSDSNKSYSFLKGSNTHEDSKVFINALSWMEVSSTTSHHRKRLGIYLIKQMTSLSLLNSRYHHHVNWTWVHTSLSSCCS